LASALGLIILSPVLLVIAVAIVAETGFPILHRQQRIGLRGKPFALFKFRSMRTNAGGTRVTAACDPRITRTGGLIRKYKLDEIPQLWNVLRGDMSLVGPRPEVPAFVDLRNRLWQQVLSRKPGITDLATLIYRNEEALLARSSDVERTYREEVLPRKLALNIRYIAERGVLSDLEILFLTVLVSVRPEALDPDWLLRRFSENHAK
jgi:lipopolysaccharide/colanic/teichoic acid biosynthesis glycosyltransferase